MPLTRIRQTAIGNDSITSAKLAHDLDFDGQFVRVPHGTTAERPSNPVNGYLRYNTNFERLEQYADGQWQSIDTPPSITSLSYPSPVTAADPAGGETITITGSNFQAGATVTVGGTNSPTVTVVSSTSITFTTPAKTAGDYDVKVTNGNGLSATLTSGLTVNGVPSFTTAANLGTVAGSTAISNLTIVAAETDGGTVSYSISTPASPDFVSINSSTGVLSGTTPAAGGANTNYNFTVTATDDENQTNTRTYTLTVLRKTYAFSIDQSLQLHAADGQYLQWTPSSGGNQKVWTSSFWVKRNAVGQTQYLWSGSSYNGNDGIAAIYFNTDDKLHTYFDTSGTNPYGAASDVIFRDTDGWYHIVWQVDAVNTTQQIWVNGQSLAMNSGMNPPNFDYGMNRANTIHRIGSQAWGASNFADISIAEFHHIDGTLVAPTNFGETFNGLWLPKQVSGLTYGTNGFYLPLKNVDNNTFFNHTTYEGNGDYYNPIDNIGFKPDMVFFKVNTQTADWEWHDSVRGWNYRLLTDPSTNGTSAQSNSETVTDAIDDGFIVRVGNSGQIGSNWNANSHTAYCFNGGNNIVDSDFQSSNGTTIQSSQTVNTTYDFSVTTWTAAGSDPGNTTVPTGLSGIADWIIVKCMDVSGTYWPVYHSSLTNTDRFLKLNATDAEATTNGWGISSTGPSMNWQTQASSAYTEFNEQSRNYIMYAWKAVSGYSAFGNYEGTGSTNAVTGLGFRPAMLIIKNIDGTGAWTVFDDLRDTTNPRLNRLWLNDDAPASDASTANYVDFDSDGFTVYGAGGDTNTNNQTYLYCAFADKRTYAFWRDASGNGNHFDVNQSIGLGLQNLTDDTPTGNY